MLAKLVPLVYSRSSSTRYSDRLHDFSVTIPWCYKGFYVSSFFRRIARFRNVLPAEYFPLTNNLNDLDCRANRLFFVWVLPKQLSRMFSSFSCFYCNSMPCNGCSAFHGVNPPRKYSCTSEGLWVFLKYFPMFLFQCYCCFFFFVMRSDAKSFFIQTRHFLTRLMFPISNQETENLKKCAEKFKRKLTLILLSWIHPTNE